MPLNDHFHPPLSARRHWKSFHNAWATYLASDLNRLLPAGYFAEPNVQFGIEIDVAAFSEGRTSVVGGEETGATSPALSATAWAPSPPAAVVDFPLNVDTVEVLIYDSSAGPTLAGAIELVSPANKDRAEHRNAFVSKCEAYLQQAIGLVVVDVVTTRRANLHEALLKRLKQNDDAPAVDLYAASYRVASVDGETKLEIWRQGFAAGDALPTLPLWLRGGLCLPVELEATYERTCREQRILAESA
jgi:hypothetical protein